MPPSVESRRAFAAALLVCSALAVSQPVQGQTSQAIEIRGQVQSLHLYGVRGGSPVVLSSGDGGWIHLGPHIAETLAARGFFIVGFDVKAYLRSFTSGKASLRPEDEPGDYKVLADFAAHGTTRKPILVGVSEGAGLSVLAATDPGTKASITGVLAVGLPDVNELGWRWKDSLIYLTHAVPNEPTFSASTIVNRVGPAPFGVIHSTHDEFVTLSQVETMLERANEPKKLWVVKASDHRFSDNLPEFDRRLLEAIGWITENAAR